MTLLSEPPRIRRWGAAAAGAVLLVGLQPLRAEAAPTPHGTKASSATSSEKLPDYDSRTTIHSAVGSAQAKRITAAAAPNAAASKLRTALGLQAVVDVDQATGTPRLVAKLNGYLTGASRRSPEAIARSYVKSKAPVFGLSPAMVDGLTLRKDYVDIAGTHHLSFVQSVGGVPVYGNGLKAHVAKDGRLIQVDGSPVSSLPSSPGTATLSAAKSRATAIADVFGRSTVALRQSSARAASFSDGGSARQVMFLTAAGPRLAWQVITMDEGFLHVVDATDGTVLLRQNLRDNDSAQTWPNYPGAPVGGKQQRVSLTRWLPDNSPRLAGNVAHVWTDVNDDNKANPDEEVKPRASGSFDFPFTDFTAAAKETGCTAAYKCSWDPKTPNSWRTNRSQNAVQMFYFIGTYHDHLRDSPIGFTRAAGNFEAVDDDAVQGQALDGANTGTGALAGLPDPNHVDNANMNTPPDGTPPVMQMYLVHNPGGEPAGSGTTIAGNTGDESDIVYHEYTHGLSNRLVVDANGVSTLGGVQAGAMGEAWSDWYAMDLLVNQGYVKDTPAAGDILIGKYWTAGHTIRSEPLDCTVGDTTKACPGTTAAGPGGYTYGDYGRVYAGGPEVHADGEIWAQTLWDLRKAIGSNKAESLITRAMEFAPANPSFLDMRNAIVEADTVVNGGKLSNTIWKIFAARGMGYFAGSESGDDSQPVEDFSMPPSVSTPRGSLTGKVTDADTSAPVAGAVVGFGGHASGFGDNYVATTATDGTYTINGIVAGTYPKVFARGAGYDTVVRTVSVASRANALNWALRRDWAARNGGGTVVSSDGPDFGDPCSPVNLIDQSQGSGWVSDAAGTGGTPDPTAIAPRSLVVKLPVAVNIAELTINPASACGVGGSASTGDYKVETSPDGTTWTLGAQGHFTPAQRVVNTIPLASGSTAKVQYVRYSMLGTQVKDLPGGTCPGAFGGCTYVSSTELAVYGTPAS